MTKITGTAGSPPNRFPRSGAVEVERRGVTEGPGQLGAPRLQRLDLEEPVGPGAGRADAVVGCRLEAEVPVPARVPQQDDRRLPAEVGRDEHGGHERRADSG